MSRVRVKTAEKATSDYMRAIAAERDMWIASRGRLAYDAEMVRRRAARNTATRARVAAVLAARNAGHQLNLLDQGDHHAI